MDRRLLALSLPRGSVTRGDPESHLHSDGSAIRLQQGGGAS
jgi:hypothetical protein